MKKIYYEKQGRRYVPVAEYDNDLLDSFPKGTHLVMVYPGGQSRRFNIDPNYAALIAAGRVAEDAICEAIHKASELKPAKTPITEGQLKAWKKLAKEFGENLFALNRSSSRDIAEAALKSLIAEQEKLLNNPAVREAFEHFLTVAALTKNQNVQDQ